jgi:hypothetical protein
MTKPLSPAAQAVMDALLSEWDVYAVSEARWATAAALRVAADQVVPHTAARTDRAANRRKIRSELLTLAAELDGGTTTPAES